MGARPLGDPEKQARIRSGPPWLRWGVDLPAAEAWADADDAALALVRKRRAYGTSLVAIGDPEAAVDLALTLAPQLDVTSVTLPRASVVPAGAVFGRRPEGVDWEWMWSDEDPTPVAGEDRVRQLDTSAEHVREELAAFLAEHSPQHSAEPDDDRARAWLGVRGDAGELVACVALYEGVPGVDLMASVAVATAARGQGLGLAVTTAATRRSLRERPPVATVDLYSDNAVARALYAELGYRLDQEFTSYRLG